MDQFNSSPSYPDLKNAALKYVKIEYTTDGINWKQFTNDQCTTDTVVGYTGMFKFAPGTGENNMPATNLADGNGVLDFGGLKARAVRFVVPNEVGVGNWGWYVANTRNNYGISEVLFTGEPSDDPTESTLIDLSIEGISLSPTFNSGGYANVNRFFISVKNTCKCLIPAL